MAERQRCTLYNKKYLRREKDEAVYNKWSVRRVEQVPICLVSAEILGEGWRLVVY